MSRDHCRGVLAWAVPVPEEGDLIFPGRLPAPLITFPIRSNILSAIVVPSVCWSLARFRLEEVCCRPRDVPKATPPGLQSAFERGPSAT